MYFWRLSLSPRLPALEQKTKLPSFHPRTCNSIATINRKTPLFPERPLNEITAVSLN
tara:strand:- start:1118 stop:1288 length:171 start_codon:yes stop_codon:yes gene_type:complete